jgi:hypothetical protein
MSSVRNKHSKNKFSKKHKCSKNESSKKRQYQVKGVDLMEV